MSSRLRVAAVLGVATFTAAGCGTPDVEIGRNLSAQTGDSGAGGGGGQDAASLVDTGSGNPGMARDSGAVPFQDAGSPEDTGVPLPEDAGLRADTGVPHDASSADTTRPPIDSGSDSPVVPTDAATSCTNVPGYPTTQGIYATITGSDLQGTYALTGPGVYCNFGTNGPSSGDYTDYASGGPVKDYGLFTLWTPGVSAPAAGTAYPMSAQLVVFTPNENPDSLTTGTPQAIYVYPPSGGPGSCTITYDEVTPPTGFDAGTGCARARFSCTGLVGSASKKVFDVTNGYVVCGGS
jgi:hypothetical protein